MKSLAVGLIGLSLSTAAFAQSRRVAIHQSSSIADAVAEADRAPPHSDALPAAGGVVGEATSTLIPGTGEAPPDPELEGRDQQGDAFYCQKRALGRWFYCEHPHKDDHPQVGDMSPALTASQRVAAISKRIDELRDRAILDPSEANLVAFMRYQREQTNRASLMADMFERTLIAHPELDYNLQRPVSTLGKQNWVEQRNSEIAQTMLQLKQRYGVFFFFASNSKSSEIEGPILRSLADNYGLTVVAVSEDGGPSSDFPDYLIDTGQREHMGLPGRQVPTIALYDTTLHKTVLISTGVVSSDDVMQRIFLLTQTEPGKDY